MPGGRPKKTLDDLPKGWKDKLIEIGEEGGSEVEMRVFLNVSEDLWYRLKEEEEEFSQTVKKAKGLCQVWWEKHGRKHLLSDPKGPQFNHVLWYMNMKNRFGWADKREDKVSAELKHEGVMWYPNKKEVGEE